MKSPSANTEAGICLPGEQTWELWKHGSGGWQPAQAENSPADFKTAAVFGYPVSAAFAVPIRAATGDEELMPDIVDFQLEKQNMKPETPVGRLLDWRMVDRGENNTLLLATVLNSEMADDLPRDAPQRFEVSPYLYYLPDDSLVIWKELGRLVFAVTRGDQPVYYHALNTPVLTVDTAAEIEQLLMPLFTQEIITHLEGIVIWTESVDHGAAEELGRTFGTRVRSERRPAPALPQAVSTIVPVSVAMEKIRAARMARIRNIVLGSLVAYLIIPGFFLVRYYLASQSVDKLRRNVNTMNVQYGHVESTIKQAKLMESVTNFDKYPIELLNQVLSPLYQPNSQLRVQKIDIERKLPDGAPEKASIRILGESNAANTQAISLYTTRIKNNTALKEWTWEPGGGQESSTTGGRSFTLDGNLKLPENAQPQ